MKQKPISSEERLNQFYKAESEGRIILPNGDWIVVGMATPGQVIWHQMEKQSLIDRTIITGTHTETKTEVEIPKKSTVELGNERVGEAMRRARGGAR